MADPCIVKIIRKPNTVTKIVRHENPVKVIKTNRIDGAGSPGLSAYQIALLNGFVGTEADWLESLVGPAGAGDDGLSAYQVAVNEGFVGTEAEWLESLKGADGADSTVPGPQGDDGLSAYEVAVNNGFVGTEAEWLLSLKGAKGDKGDDGADSTVPGPKGDDGDPGPLQVFIQPDEPVVAPGVAFLWLNPEAGDGDDYLLQMGIGL